MDLMEQPENSERVSKMQSVEYCLSLLMDAYKVYQGTLKHSEATTKVDQGQDPDDTAHQRLLADAYHKYTCCVAPNNNAPRSNDENLLDEAIKFCQQQNAFKKATNTSSTAKTTSSVVTSSPKQPHNTFKPVVTSQASRDNLAAVREVKELSIEDPGKDSPENGITRQDKFHPAADKSSKGKVTIVEKGGMTYTRIGPPRTDQHRSFAPSPGSAFRPAASPDGADGKRLRLDPGLRHLRGANEASKRGLTRSTSVPVTKPDGEENTPPHHRPLYRTGSFVSDYTKNKLKSAILAKTSAALVRKPSITDQEMMQIHDDQDADSDSSQSEDEEEQEQEENLRKRKYPAHQPAVITTAGST